MKNKEGFDKDNLGFLFGEISRMHHSRVHSFFAKNGLQRGQPPILFILSKNDGVTQTEIADSLKLSPATITDILQRMEKTELVERRKDEQDQRITRVFITEKGRERQKEVDNAFESLDEGLFKGFTFEEKVLLRRFFLQIRENLEDMHRDE